jgi:hypothetical protein
MTSASGCGAHFCYLCQADWDQSNYRCTNSSGRCPSSVSGGGNIYAVQEKQDVSDFERLNEECASHIASLRLAATFVTEFEKGPKGLFTKNGSDDTRAADALHSLARALVESFRYLANAAVTLFSLPEQSPLRQRLIILQVKYIVMVCVSPLILSLSLFRHPFNDMQLLRSAGWTNQARTV